LPDAMKFPVTRIRKVAPLPFVAGLFALLCTTQAAEVPPQLHVQGRVTVNGAPFTGSGQFKFALISGDGFQARWLNSPDEAPQDGIPDKPVSLPVNRGLYSVALGDPNVANMTHPVSPAVLAAAGIHLRVWFDDGVHGFQQLSPDLPFHSVAFALVADTARVAEMAATLAPPSNHNSFGGAPLPTGLTGFQNTAQGSGALSAITSGFNNTAQGAAALARNTSGIGNVAIGVAALSANTEGMFNTALGHDALHDNTTGSYNIAVGADAGRSLTGGHHKIAIGHPGVAGDSHTIRLGTPGLHTATHLAGTVKVERLESSRESTSGVMAWGANGSGQRSQGGRRQAASVFAGPSIVTCDSRWGPMVW
jgi:hypothetical protein